MATKITDSATAEAAARSLDKGLPVKDKGEPQASREKGTTEKLFPDFVTADGAISNIPVKSDVVSETPPAKATPPAPEVKDVKPATPAKAEPTKPDYLDPTQISGKMVRTKVDGVEMDVPAEQVFKNFQLERHLQNRIQEVEKLAKTIEQRSIVRPAETTQPAPPARKPSATPEVEALNQQIAAMQKELAGVQEVVRDTRYQKGIDTLDKHVRETYGAEDFKEFVPQIQAFVKSQLKDPTAPTAEEIAAYDSANFYVQKYQEMKLKSLLSGQKQTPKVDGPVLSKEPANAPLLDKGANIPDIESADGAPAHEDTEDAWQVRYNRALKQAKASGKTEDWMQVTKLKFAQR